MGYSPWGRKESDMTEHAHMRVHFIFMALTDLQPSEGAQEITIGSSRMGTYARDHNVILSMILLTDTPDSIHAEGRVELISPHQEKGHDLLHLPLVLIYADQDKVACFVGKILTEGAEALSEGTSHDCDLSTHQACGPYNPCSPWEVLLSPSYRWGN